MSSLRSSIIAIFKVIPPITTKNHYLYISIIDLLTFSRKNQTDDHLRQKMTAYIEIIEDKFCLL